MINNWDELKYFWLNSTHIKQQCLVCSSALHHMRLLLHTHWSLSSRRHSHPRHKGSNTRPSQFRVTRPRSINRQRHKSQVQAAKHRIPLFSFQWDTNVPQPIVFLYVLPDHVLYQPTKPYEIHWSTTCLPGLHHSLLLRASCLKLEINEFGCYESIYMYFRLITSKFIYKPQPFCLQ